MEKWGEPYILYPGKILYNNSCDFVPLPFIAASPKTDSQGLKHYVFRHYGCMGLAIVSIYILEAIVVAEVNKCAWN